MSVPKDCFQAPHGRCTFADVPREGQKRRRPCPLDTERQRLDCSRPMLREFHSTWRDALRRLQRGPTAPGEAARLEAELRRTTKMLHEWMARSFAEVAAASGPDWTGAHPDRRCVQVRRRCAERARTTARQRDCAYATASQRLECAAGLLVDAVGGLLGLRAGAPVVPALALFRHALAAVDARLRTPLGAAAARPDGAPADTPLGAARAGLRTVLDAVATATENMDQLGDVDRILFDHEYAMTDSDMLINHRLMVIAGIAVNVTDAAGRAFPGLRPAPARTLRAATPADCQCALRAPARRTRASPCSDLFPDRADAVRCGLALLGAAVRELPADHRAQSVKDAHRAVAQLLGWMRAARNVADIVSEADRTAIGALLPRA
jgi:hypothetical protein